MSTAISDATTEALTAIDAPARCYDLGDLTNDLTSALNGAICSFMLRAELEDAFDTAFLRSFMAETPIMYTDGRCSAR